MDDLVKRTMIAAALLGVFALTPASGQNSGTPEDRAACEGNVKRYCSKAIEGGDMAILACLQQNRPRLTPSCQQVLIKYGQ
jgi:hypothetical protein